MLDLAFTIYGRESPDELAAFRRVRLRDQNESVQSGK